MIKDLPDFNEIKSMSYEELFKLERSLKVKLKVRKARYKKFANTNKSIDFIKLEDFTNMNCYNYFLGVFVKLNKNTAQYTYFQNGQETAREDLSDE